MAVGSWHLAVDSRQEEKQVTTTYNLVTLSPCLLVS